MANQQRKKWTGEEIAQALNDYFSGCGIATVAENLGDRSVYAVEDVLKHDLPRNYRNIINLLKGVKSRASRSKRPWSRHEQDYLRLLLKRLSKEECCTILGRSPSDLAKQLAKWGPRQNRSKLA